METALIKTVGGRKRCYPLAQPRVTTHLGSGSLVYATDDGWVGVQLDGETRIDEYTPAMVTLDPTLAAAA